MELGSRGKDLAIVSVVFNGALPGGRAAATGDETDFISTAAHSDPSEHQSLRLTVYFDFAQGQRITEKKATEQKE